MLQTEFICHWAHLLFLNAQLSPSKKEMAPSHVRDRVSSASCKNLRSPSKENRSFSSVFRTHYTKEHLLRMLRFLTEI